MGSRSLGSPQRAHVGKIESSRLGPSEGARVRCDRAFSLLDVLVSLMIIAILIGLLIPVISKANEAARRVVCQSNVRQLGVAMLMYADANKEYLPHSRYVDPLPGEPQTKRPDQMIFARLESDADLGERWDGLGYLFKQDYLPAPGVFYCPSHSGLNRYSDVFESWQQQYTFVPTNYQYRGEGPSGHPGMLGAPVPMTHQLFRIDPAQSSLIADGMRTQADINHPMGINYFRADLTVHWYLDTGRQIANMIPAQADDASGDAATAVTSAWGLLDVAASSGQSSSTGPR